MPVHEAEYIQVSLNKKYKSELLILRVLQARKSTPMLFLWRDEEIRSASTCRSSIVGETAAATLLERGKGCSCLFDSHRSDVERKRSLTGF